MAVLTLKNDEFKTFPGVLQDYAHHMVAIKGNSPKTVCEYLMDLRTFFRFMISQWEDIDPDKTSLEEISIKKISEDDIRRVTQKNIIQYLMYANIDRENSPTTRMRKLSALRSFFKYAHTKEHIIDVNPTADIDSPKKGQTLPKYLTVEEAYHLIETVKNDRSSKTRIRDYTIIVLFLNTGMRLSELVGLNIESFDSELTFVRVIGKGNKERIIYLNKAASKAMERYLRVRLDPKHVKTSSGAVFLSGRDQRISNKTVQWMVGKYLKLAGYGSKKLSVHKLRHTAATLMYQSGKVDIRVLKEILGHEQLNTTQIYTHVVSRNIEEAVEQNPLADLVFKDDKNDS